MDGMMFRQVEENAEQMEFITKFYKEGVHCPNMQSVFPTKTLVKLQHFKGKKKIMIHIFRFIPFFTG